MILMVMTMMKLIQVVRNCGPEWFTKSHRSQQKVMVCPQLGVSPAMDSYIIMIVASESGHFNIRTSRPNAFLLSCFYMLLSLNSSRLHIRFFSTSQVQNLLVTSLLFAGLLNLRFDQRLMASHLSRSHDDDAPHRSTHPVIWP